MLVSWYDVMMLGLEANRVIGLRLARIARGGTASFDEVRLMCSEKMLACAEAGTALAAGVGADGVVALYRSKVARNEARLSA